jgi:hypothetical protein
VIEKEIISFFRESLKRKPDKWKEIDNALVLSIENICAISQGEILRIKMERSRRLILEADDQKLLLNKATKSDILMFRKFLKNAWDGTQDPMVQELLLKISPWLSQLRKDQEVL